VHGRYSEAFRVGVDVHEESVLTLDGKLNGDDDDVDDELLIIQVQLANSSRTYITRTNKLTNQSTNHPINKKSINQSINQSSNQSSYNQPTTCHFNQFQELCSAPCVAFVIRSYQLYERQSESTNVNQLYLATTNGTNHGE